MKSISIHSINFTVLKFTGFFIGSVALCIFILTSFREPLPVQSLQVNAALNSNPDDSYVKQLTAVTPQQPVELKPDLSTSKMLDSIKESKTEAEKQMKEMQKELEAKNALLLKLQSQLKTKPVQMRVEEVPSSKQAKKMKDEIEFLKWALRSEVSSNHALTNSNNQLKQANASLNNQLKGSR